VILTNVNTSSALWRFVLLLRRFFPLPSAKLPSLTIFDSFLRQVISVIPLTHICLVSQFSAAVIDPIALSGPVSRDLPHQPLFTHPKHFSLLKKLEVLGTTNLILSSIRHGPH
jgi:hypothetical protein